jgi:hypothetical protein
MTAWRVGLSVVLLVAAVPASRGQTATLAETIKPGDCFRVGIDMKLTGEMRFLRDNGKSSAVKLSAQASHAFPERVLVGSGATIQKSARSYETAKATIQRGNDRSENAVRASRKLIVAQRNKDQFLVYSPAGALSRSELEVVSEHFDTLHLAGLLPGKEVKVGETWTVAGPVAQALSSLEGMTEHKLAGKLEKVAGNEATFSVVGTVSGIWQGAQVKASVEATGTFDLAGKRLTRLVWKQKDDRDQGPASPASSLETTVTLTRKPIDQPTSLSDVALVSVPDGFSPPGPMTNLEYREYRDPKGRYSLVHTRDWFLTAASDDQAVMRLIDKVWVAQVTVTPWTKAKKGEHLSGEEFKTAMNNTSGWRPERELQAGELKVEGKWVYRLSVLGQLNGVAVMQNFYLVAAPGGEQVVLTFTLSPRMADKLGARDLSLASSIEVPASTAK